MLAAPLFVFLHVTFFQHTTLDLNRVLSDKKALFFLLLFYPVIEELAFRGVIQEFIASRTKQWVFYPLSLANMLTSVLFVLIHFIHHPPLWAMMVFVPSLIFGYFKEQYGRIYPSILLHIFYNAASLFLVVQQQ